MTYRSLRIALASVALVSAGFAQSPFTGSPERDDTAASGAVSEALGSLVGTTRCADGKPAPAAQVVISDPANDASRLVTSDEQGAFEVSGLKPGAYALKASKEGLAGTTQGIVAAGHSVHVEITLVESSTVPVARGAFDLAARIFQEILPGVPG